jgi:hypothetical protein
MAMTMMMNARFCGGAYAIPDYDVIGSRKRPRGWESETQTDFLGPSRKRPRVIGGAVTNNRSWRRRTNGYGATTADFKVFGFSSDDDVDTPVPMDESEAMDVDVESVPMDYTNLIDEVDLVTQFAALSVKCDLDEAIGDVFNVTIDEQGNFVRRSARLNGCLGSIWWPVSDTRVQRRSARLQNKKDGVRLV